MYEDSVKFSPYVSAPSGLLQAGFGLTPFTHRNISLAMKTSRFPWLTTTPLTVVLFASACGVNKPSTTVAPKAQKAPQARLAPVSESNLALVEEVRRQYPKIRFEFAKGLDVNNEALESTLRLLLNPETLINKHVTYIVFNRFNGASGNQFGIYEVATNLTLDVQSAFDSKKQSYFLEHTESLKASKVKVEVWGELVRVADELEKKNIQLDVDYENLSAAQILETTQRIQKTLPKIENLSLISIANNEYVIGRSVTLNAASRGDREAEQVNLLIKKETLKTTQNREALEEQRARLEEHLKPFIPEFRLYINYAEVDRKSAEQLLKFLARGFSIGPDLQSINLGTKNQIIENLSGRSLELNATQAIDEKTIKEFLLK